MREEEPATTMPPPGVTTAKPASDATTTAPADDVELTPLQASALELPPELKEYEKFASENLEQEYDAFEGVYTTPKPMLELHKPSASPDDRIARIRAMVGNMVQPVEPSFVEMQEPVETSFVEMHPPDVLSQRRLEQALDPREPAPQSLGEVAAYTAATAEQAAKVEAELAAYTAATAEQAAKVEAEL